MFELWIVTSCWAFMQMPNGATQCTHQGFRVYASSKTAIADFSGNKWESEEFWLYHIQESPKEERHILIPVKAIDKTRPIKLDPRVKIRKREGK